MKKLSRNGLALLSILTVTAAGWVRAEQPLMVANESACFREKLRTAFPELAFPVSELTFQLASHQCDGDRCYVVNDEASCGDANPASVADSQSLESPDSIFQSDAAPPMVTSPLGRSLGGFSSPSKAAPANPPEMDNRQALTELRVLNSELVARLEMSQAILELQNHYTEQILSLERENARLACETAELRVKNEVNEQLTAGLIERAELTAKLAAAHDWISSRTAYEASLSVQMNPETVGSIANYQETISAIQEELSNLRRQLPLLKRTPVPFATSSTVSHQYPYVPIGCKPEVTAGSTTEPRPSSEETDSPCREATTREGVGAR